MERRSGKAPQSTIIGEGTASLSNQGLKSEKQSKGEIRRAKELGNLMRSMSDAEEAAKVAIGLGLGKHRAYFIKHSFHFFGTKLNSRK